MSEREMSKDLRALLAQAGAEAERNAAAAIEGNLRAMRAEAEAARLRAEKNAVPGLIAARLEEKAAAADLGATFHGGPLHGTSIYNAFHWAAGQVRALAARDASRPADAEARLGAFAERYGADPITLLRYVDGSWRMTWRRHYPGGAESDLRETAGGPLMETIAQAEAHEEANDRREAEHAARAEGGAA